MTKRVDVIVVGTYGSLELAAGNWIYTLDQTTVQELDAGDELEDALTGIIDGWLDDNI